MSIVESVSSPTIPMSPRGVITWDVIEAAWGHVYLPPMDGDLPFSLQDVLCYADEDPSRLPFINSGNNARVYEYQNFALKIIKGNSSSDAACLDTIRANVILSAGLRAMNQDIPRLEGFHFSAPQIHLAYLTDNKHMNPDRASAVILMDKVEGTSPFSVYDLPPHRHAYYHQALGRYGLSPSAVRLDDIPGNTLMQAGSGDAVTEVSKLDVQRELPFNF